MDTPLLATSVLVVLLAAMTKDPEQKNGNELFFKVSIPRFEMNPYSSIPHSLCDFEASNNAKHTDLFPFIKTNVSDMSHDLHCQQTWHGARCLTTH